MRKHLPHRTPATRLQEQYRRSSLKLDRIARALQHQARMLPKNHKWAKASITHQANELSLRSARAWIAYATTDPRNL